MEGVLSKLRGFVGHSDGPNGETPPLMVHEHIPVNLLADVFDKIRRLLRPSGIVANSYNIDHGGRDRPVFRAHQAACLEWLKADTIEEHRIRG